MTLEAPTDTVTRHGELEEERDSFIFAAERKLNLLERQYHSIAGLNTNEDSKDEQLKALRDEAEDTFNWIVKALAHKTAVDQCVERSIGVMKRIQRS